MNQTIGKQLTIKTRSLKTTFKEYAGYQKEEALQRKRIETLEAEIEKDTHKIAKQVHQNFNDYIRMKFYKKHLKCILMF